VKIMKNFFFGILLIAACAAVSAAQGTAGDKGAPPTSLQTTTSNSADFPKGWQVYNLGSKDTFRAALPQKPEIESEDMKSGDRTMKVTYFTASSSDILTVIADISDLPIESDRLTEANKIYLFQKVREGLLEGMKSELEKTGFKAEIKFNTQKNISLKGISGYEQDLSVGQIKGRARMLSVKDHIYIFFTLLLDESKQSLMSDFLDSFEYVGAK
jgi:hypothetical protein